MAESGRRTKSLVANFAKWSETRHEYIDFLMDDTDPGLWWIRIRDLTGEFTGGEYIVEMRAPLKYPFEPPEFYFKTPTGVYGIDTKICISIGEFHKDKFAAAQGGMGGFALQLINGIIYWQNLGHGIAILNSEYYSANKNRRNEMEPVLKSKMAILARESMDWNRAKYPNLVAKFDNLPFNKVARVCFGLPYSSRCIGIMKKYLSSV